MSQSHSPVLTFDQALNNARGIGVMTGEQVEREIVKERNSSAPKCSHGHATTYSHAVGAYRCEWGALVRGSGKVVRSCQA
jgi:hypothetical protein